jgi:hypothetical protein
MGSEWILGRLGWGAQWIQLAQDTEYSNEPSGSGTDLELISVLISERNVDLIPLFFNFCLNLISTWRVTPLRLSNKNLKPK